MVVKKKADQTDFDRPTHIVISIDYDTKLILPIEKGMEFVSIWATGIELKSAYQKKDKLGPVDKDFQLKFITDAKLRQMQVANMLESDNDD